MPNNNRKRAETLGPAAVAAQAKRASMQSPWRKSAFCATDRAMRMRAKLDETPK